MSTTDFNGFGFDERILRALDETGHKTPTPIQEQAIPLLLQGKDLVAVAQTGTGKTAAFALPAIQILSEKPIKVGPNEVRALILAPTRELATQIEKNMKIYARHLKLKHACVYGGMPYRPQIQDMKKGVDVLVATPGRLIDLLERGHVNLAFLELLILDEADRMLDMGFIHDIRALIDLMPEDRQSLLFSATMPPKVGDLARTLLQEPVSIEITPESTPVDRIKQSVMFVKAVDKLPLLLSLIKKDEYKRVIIFTKTRYKADKVADHISKTGIVAEAIHGDKSQAKRQRVLNGFQKGKVQILVATDVAARGIDVSDITHVINYELPMEAESYVHRIGRTARAGSTGTAIAFCDGAERGLLSGVERNMKMQLPVDTNHDWHDEKSAQKSGGAGGGNSRNRSGGGGRGGFAGKRDGGGSRDAGAGRREGSKARWGKPRRDKEAPRRDSRPNTDRDSRNDNERQDRLANSNNYRRDRDQTPVKSLFDRPSRDENTSRDARKDNDRDNDKRSFSKPRERNGLEGGNRNEFGRGGRGRNTTQKPRRSGHQGDSRDDGRENNSRTSNLDGAKEHSRPARHVNKGKETSDFKSPKFDDKPASRRGAKPAGKSFKGKPGGGKAYAEKKGGPVKGKRQASNDGGSKPLFRGRP